MTNEERKALEKYGLVRHDSFAPPADQLARVQRAEKKKKAPATKKKPAPKKTK